MRTSRAGALAAIPGGICWIFATAAGVLGELDYRGLTDNPIPDPVGFVIAALGSILLLVGLVNIRRIQADRGGSPGGPGYYIAMAGLAITVVPVWPLIFIGPILVGIGATIYGVATMASGSIRSLGTWMHVLSIPIALVTAFMLAAGGYDGGLGMVAFSVLISGGFMSLGYDVAAPPSPVAAQEVTA